MQEPGDHLSATVHRRHGPSRDLVTLYLDEIGAFQLLSRAEEGELARRIRAGDAEALEHLVCANLRFVVSIAKKYQMRGVALIDLINEGNIGLMHAAERFDETKGVKFISYAVWWVRQMIFQALAAQGHAVRVPASRGGALFRLGRQAEELRQDLGREPTRDELGAASAMTDEQLEEALPLTRASVSLDASLRRDDDATLLDYLAPDDAAAADQQASASALTASINEALTALRAREARVVRLYFGFDGKEPMTLEAIGAEMGITRERARQIKERALRKLRRSVHRETLAAFCV